jgi:hydroxymethylbilane synthase
MQQLCDKINHHHTWELEQVGRAFLEYLDADCQTPIAAYSVYIGQEQNIYTEFMLADFDGGNIIFHNEISAPNDRQNAGIKAAKIMLNLQNVAKTKF